MSLKGNDLHRRGNYSVFTGSLSREKFYVGVTVNVNSIAILLIADRNNVTSVFSVISYSQVVS